jgi:guanyl-specific ribonuclease Sa
MTAGIMAGGALALFAGLPYASKPTFTPRNNTTGNRYANSTSIGHTNTTTPRTRGIPQEAWTVLERVDTKGAPFQDYKGGGVYANGNGLLPQTPGVVYREWDIHMAVPGVNRGTERLVTGSDGSAYYTADHYHSFIMLRGPK